MTWRPHPSMRAVRRRPWSSTWPEAPSGGGRGGGGEQKGVRAAQMWKCTKCGKAGTYHFGRPVTGPFLKRKQEP